ARVQRDVPLAFRNTGLWHERARPTRPFALRKRQRLPTLRATATSTRVTSPGLAHGDASLAVPAIVSRLRVALNPRLPDRSAGGGRSRSAHGVAPGGGGVPPWHRSPTPS